MSQQAYVDALQALLAADSGVGGVNTLVEGRIFNSLAAQDCATPYLLHAFVTDVPVKTFGARDLDDEFNVIIYAQRADGPAGIRAIAERVYAVLDGGTGQKLTGAGFTVAWTSIIDRGIPAAELDYFRQVMRWRMVGSGA